MRLHAAVVAGTFLFFGYKLALLLAGRLPQLRALRARSRWADSALLATALLTGLVAWLTYPSPAGGGGWFPALLTLGLLVGFVRVLRQERKGPATFGLLAALLAYGLWAYSVPAEEPNQPNTLQQALLGQAPNAAALGSASPTAGQAETGPTPNAAAPVDTTDMAASTGFSEADAATVASATEPIATGGAALQAGKSLFQQNCAVCHGPDGKLGLNGAHDLTKSNLNTAGRVYMVTQGLGKMPSFKGQLTETQIQQVVAYSLTLKQ